MKEILSFLSVTFLFILGITFIMAAIKTVYDLIKEHLTKEISITKKDPADEILKQWDK